MKTFELNGAVRNVVGKVANKAARKEGFVPCAIYGLEQTLHIVIEEKPLLKVLYTPDTYLIHLAVEGKVYKVIVANSSYHPVHDNLLDVEFMVVKEDRDIQVNLPVYLVGNSVGVISGGKLVQKLKKMKVRGLYTNLPAKIDIDITDLKLGRSLKVSDLSYDNFSIAMAKDVPICSVEITRALRQEANAAGKGK